MTQKSVVITLLVALVALSSLSWAKSKSKSPADLNDLEIAHVAYTADSIDIRYAHLALAISKDPKVRAFADTMIRDHTIVNEKALALVKKLNVQPQDNFLSQALVKQSDALIEEMRQLNGLAFDRRYASNELSYHQAVNNLVGKTFIPNIQNPEVKALFEEALVIFKAHEGHAQHMVNALGSAHARR